MPVLKRLISRINSRKKHANKTIVKQICYPIQNEENTYTFIKNIKNATLTSRTNPISNEYENKKNITYNWKLSLESQTEKKQRKFELFLFERNLAKLPFFLYIMTIFHILCFIFHLIIMDFDIFDNFL